MPKAGHDGLCLTYGVYICMVTRPHPPDVLDIFPREDVINHSAANGSITVTSISVASTTTVTRRVNTPKGVLYVNSALSYFAKCLLIRCVPIVLLSPIITASRKD